MGKRSRKQRGSAPPERRASAPPRQAEPAKKKRRGPEPRPWPERPSVTRAKNEAARDAARASRPSRTEAKNAAAREALVPLEEGERPLAVTIGGVVALLLGLANIVLYIAGVKVGGQKPTLTSIAGPTLIMFVAAYGMWRSRYWAVLGVEALLGLIIVFFAVLATRAANVTSLAIALAVIVPCGALFWFLIKAMARIQMPERPGGTPR